MTTALVTGHTGGLGQGFREHLLGAGWRVLGLARREAPAHQRLDQRRCDLSRLDTVAGALDALLERIDRLELVLLNAGILGRIQPLSETPMDEIREIMDVNVWANKVILDRLLARRVRLGQVVLISSGAAANASYGWGGYALSKATLNTLARLYAHELPDAHLVALAPGLVDTAMQDYLCAEVDPDEFPSVGKLKHARGTDAMPEPRAAAERIIALLPRLQERFPSGAFVDVRDLD